MSITNESKEAIQELFKLHADGIYRYASYMLPMQHDAKDIVQEVFLRAYQSWDGLHKKTSARTWLYTIARNCVYDLMRKNQSERATLNRYSSDIRNNVLGLGSTLEYEELIRQMQESYRQVLILRSIEGLSTAETAKVMGVSESKVRITFHRAKKKFANLLAADEPATYRIEGEKV